MMTANQARAMFDDVKTNKPDRWPAAVQTLIVNALETIEYHESQINDLVDKTTKLNKALVQLLQGLRGTAEAPLEAEVAVGGEAPPEVPADVPAPANGHATQSDVEATMDAAVAAEAAEKRSGPRPAAPTARTPQRRPQPQGKAPARSAGPPPVGRPGTAPSAVGGFAPPAPGEVRIGGDGKPLSAEQAALEAQMDEAVAAEQAEKRG